MISASQNIANVRSAERIVAIEMDIDSPGGDWRANLTYEQRIAFDKALAAYIVEHPAAFADGTLETARRIVDKNYAPLSDPSFDWSAFASAAVDEAAEAAGKVSGVGEGVLTVASAAKWAIQLVAAVAVVILLVRLARRGVAP